MNRSYSKSGLHLTESFEGCRLVAYQDDGGVWTIGYGHTFGIKQGDTCTQQQAEAWLMMDVRNAVCAVNNLVKAELTQHEFDALVDFVFNVGGGNNFRNSTLLRLLNAGDFPAAAEEFHKWDKCKGREIAGLLRRRLAEREEFNAPNDQAPTA